MLTTIQCLTLWRLNNWQKVLHTRLDFFGANCSNIAHAHTQQNHREIMNEQKLMKFCMLIPMRIGHCSGYFLVAMTKSRAVNYGCFWWTSFSPCKNMLQKRHVWKTGKNSAETQTEISETDLNITSLQLILFLRPWKHHVQFLQMSLFILKTLMSTLFAHCLLPFLHPKRWNFHQAEVQGLHLVSGESSWWFFLLDTWEKLERR